MQYDTAAKLYILSKDETYIIRKWSKTMRLAIMYFHIRAAAHAESIVATSMPISRARFAWMLFLLPFYTICSDFSS